MTYRISCKNKDIKTSIHLTASKSESNRALIMSALCKHRGTLGNLSDSDDTKVLQSALDQIKSDTNPIEINIGAAGTSMRFLTAYAAQSEGKEIILSGTERMHQRPIHELVNALRAIGADITYIEKEGYPPLCIRGRKLRGGNITIDAGISSQFISALLMIAPTLEEGLNLQLKGEIISTPYINMTINMMSAFGIEHSKGNSETSIEIPPQSYRFDLFNISADWSSASYWYLIALFSKSCHIELIGLKRNSLQGDAVVAKIFEPLGVNTSYTINGTILQKKTPDIDSNKVYELNLSDCPDLAPSIAIAYAAKGIPIHLKGLKTLRIKESDRIEAIISELSKIGIKAYCIFENELMIESGTIHKPLSPIETFEDHRKAMSFAPLALCFEHIDICNPSVVKKSYPEFWNDLKKSGFEINPL